jgi:uncharacterized membrane protein
MTLAFHLGPIAFEQAWWLALAPVLWVLAVWIGRSTLTGMGTPSRRVALLVRLLVIGLLVMTVARPNWRREGENVAVTVIVDASRSIPVPLAAKAEQYLREATGEPGLEGRRGDALGRVIVGRDAYVQAIPGPPDALPDAQQTIDRDGTNLAEAVRLAMAPMPQEMANRILIISDGNETAGSLLAQAEEARAAGVPIDVLPLKYTHEREVIVDRVVVPATARMGETLGVRVLISATAPAVGRLSVLVDGEPVDLDPDSPAVGQLVRLAKGSTSLSIPLTVHDAGARRFDAVFEPMPDENNVVGDTVPENNRASAVTFVAGEGKVLVVSPTEDDAGPLMRALRESRIDAKLAPPAEGVTPLVELGAYDAVILVNTPAYPLSIKQQEDLRAYVHDLGGGLIVIGGPESYGAGGWIGSPTADALPVKLDPPQKRQMPRGALALVMHSCEMPEGNYWGQETALAAVRNLSRQDLVGVVEYSWQGGGDSWVYPLSEVGDGVAVRRAIKNLTFGDAQSFQGMLTMAITSLEKADAGQKHCIIISDADPAPPTRELVQRFINAKVSISTVMVFPHMGTAGSPDYDMMRDLARSTGGNFYFINDPAKKETLPEIFIKEAQTVRRALIWEGQPFAPTVSNATAEPMRGFGGGVPAITGYIITADREGLSTIMLRGKEDDPILASWQYGLGRSIAFTSDATGRWARAWTSWDKFRSFWEQQVRWAMRPSGSADIRVVTENLDDKTRVIVEALDPNGQRLNFARFRGRVVGPDGAATDVDLRQTGPGRYEGEFGSSRSGSYVVNLRYDAMGQPGADGAPGARLEGAVQAGVSRPFADEFRALSDNFALLRQVAERTGGRVMPLDPRRAEVWSRAGLTMPVSLRPIWPIVAAVGIGLFLVDVGVRRVRVDLGLVAMAVRRALGRKAEKAAGELGGLKQARERAQRAMAERAKAAEQQRQTTESIAGVKFEASPRDAAAAKGRAGEYLATGDPPSKGGPVKPGAVSAPGAPGAPGADKAQDENISRLLKAKRKAREGMEEEGEGPGARG